jgi:hypothetical protein
MIQRYSLMMDFSVGPSLMFGAPDGDYVLFTDHQSVIASLTQQVAEMKKVLDKLSAWNKRYPKGREWQFGMYAQIERELDAICDECEAALQLASLKEGDRGFSDPNHKWPY